MASYKDVKADLQARIAGGVWPPGAQIPNEEDLARAFGCARSTVNRAMRELAAAGLVERKRKAGTRVARRRARGALVTIAIIRHEIEGQGKRYGYVRLLREEAALPDSIAAPLGLRPGSPGLHLRCLHSADAVPCQLEDRWISLETVPAAREESFETVGPNEWLVTQVPYTTAEHVFSAAMPDGAERRALGIAPGAPVFVIERRTWQAAAGVTYVRLLHPPSHRLIARDPEWPS